MPRLFIAIELPAEVREDLATVQRRLAPLAAGGMRWTEADRIHLTLVFLGDVPDERVGEVRQAMDVAAAGGAPMDLAVGRPGVFGRPAAPRVIWMGVDGPAGLADLHGRLAEGMRSIGCDMEERPFAPHLTLGRARDGVRNRFTGRELNMVGDGCGRVFRAGEIVLFESVRGVGGTVYHAIHRSVLGARV